MQRLPPSTTSSCGTDLDSSARPFCLIFFEFSHHDAQMCCHGTIVYWRQDDGEDPSLIERKHGIPRHRADFPRDILLFRTQASHHTHQDLTPQIFTSSSAQTARYTTPPPHRPAREAERHPPGTQPSPFFGKHMGRTLKTNDKVTDFLTRSQRNRFEVEAGARASKSGES